MWTGIARTVCGVSVILADVAGGSTHEVGKNVERNGYGADFPGVVDGAGYYTW